LNIPSTPVYSLDHTQFNTITIALNTLIEAISTLPSVISDFAEKLDLIASYTSVTADNTTSIYTKITDVETIVIAVAEKLTDIGNKVTGIETICNDINNNTVQVGNLIQVTNGAIDTVNERMDVIKGILDDIKSNTNNTVFHDEILLSLTGIETTLGLIDTSTSETVIAIGVLNGVNTAGFSAVVSSVDTSSAAVTDLLLLTNSSLNGIGNQLFTIDSTISDVVSLNEDMLEKLQLLIDGQTSFSILFDTRLSAVLVGFDTLSIGLGHVVNNDIYLNGLLVNLLTDIYVQITSGFGSTGAFLTTLTSNQVTAETFVLVLGEVLELLAGFMPSDMFIDVHAIRLVISPPLTHSVSAPIDIAVVGTQDQSDNDCEHDDQSYSFV